jgi:hypothetical protein
VYRLCTNKEKEEKKRRKKKKHKTHSEAYPPQAAPLSGVPLCTIKEKEEENRKNRGEIQNSFRSACAPAAASRRVHHRVCMCVFFCV